MQASDLMRDLRLLGPALKGVGPDFCVLVGVDA
jgi:hypothetical protein